MNVEVKELKKEIIELKAKAFTLDKITNEVMPELLKESNKYRKALEELVYLLQTEEPFCYCSCGDEIIDKINEVLND